MSTIAENLLQVNTNIKTCIKKYQRPEDCITLLAVSKAQPLAAINAAYAAGQRHFAESYLQEALPKINNLLSKDIIWHYIGRIQSNKTKALAQNFSWVQTVTSAKIANLLNQYHPQELPPLNICIQVNIDNQPTKAGVLPNAILALAENIKQLPNLKLRGLMCIPAPHADFTAQLQTFSVMTAEFGKLKNLGFALDTLSMGMSDDYEAAIAAGTTMIRIGTAIFGTRI
jgi:PLP dependent protein